MSVCFFFPFFFELSVSCIESLNSPAESLFPLPPAQTLEGAVPSFLRATGPNPLGNSCFGGKLGKSDSAAFGVGLELEAKLLEGALLFDPEAVAAHGVGVFPLPFGTAGLRYPSLEFEDDEDDAIASHGDLPLALPCSCLEVADLMLRMRLEFAWLPIDA